ncbi:natural cytotoxicity triggering receptor 3 ligand 1 isoform X2 [Tupaia chinensis]|uniref:natural cytotoxicity triggering receptor 3 ligand 1 isoform X2 n=1 Tax=Tupaia chinensis TaxID=246437 RepID=UPI000FFCB45D|nr:natural cytotoxicity triggering receptor 3 ligand 1 isoform X2 [Tupaia chinensis]
MMTALCQLGYQPALDNALLTSTLTLLVVLQATGSLEVEMAGNTQTAFLNDNVTIICKIPGSPLLDIKIIGITWFRKSPKSGMEVKLFECFGKHRTVFRPGASVSPVRLKTGDASLQLPDVQLWETGEYRCEVVVTPQKAKGRVWLHVLAHPTSALFPEKPVVKGNEDNHTVESERTHVWWIPSLIIIGLIILVSSCVWKRSHLNNGSSSYTERRQ